MRSPLFEWTDILRISKSVFDDTPIGEAQIRAWTGTLFTLCTTSSSILRQIETAIHYDSYLYNGVYQSIQDSIEELMKCVNLFQDFRLGNILNWIYENVIAANLGYIKILSTEEIETDG